MEADERVLVLEVLGEAARALWNEGALKDQIDVRTFDDDFQIVTSPPRERVSQVRIMRVQSV
jgi:hypothetical protein